MMLDPARCIPILASLEIPETRDFYVWQLGFAVGYETPHYLIVKRDDIELHFWKTNQRQFPENTSCYIRGGQVSALFEEFKQNRVPRLSSFEVRPWEMKEFYIHDPHGNLLKFGCSEWWLPISRYGHRVRRRCWPANRRSHPDW